MGPAGVIGSTAIRSATSGSITARNTTATAVASCLAGEKLLGGGFVKNMTPGAGATAANVRDNWERIQEMSSVPAGSTWSATIRIAVGNMIAGSSASVTAYAVCGQ